MQNAGPRGQTETAAAALSTGLLTAWLCPASKRKKQPPFKQTQHESLYFQNQSSKLRSRREDRACVRVSSSFISLSIKPHVWFSSPAVPSPVQWGQSGSTHRGRPSAGKRRVTGSRSEASTPDVQGSLARSCDQSVPFKQPVKAQ